MTETKRKKLEADLFKMLEASQKIYTVEEYRKLRVSWALICEELGFKL
jgi:hypothetical protein